MRVIGSGFGRTGTLSTKFALERLGFGPCHHMEEVVRHPLHGREWVRIARGGTPDWPSLFAGYDAAVDFPAAVVWKELLAQWPEAKVLHTVRDPERWYDSTASTIFRSPEFVAGWLRRFTPAGYPVEVAIRMVWDGIFDGRFADRDHAIAVYEAWTQDVIDTVPADRLLVFEVRDGWEPLCEFLDVPVPDEPFPNVNDKAMILRRFRLIQWAGRIIPAAAASAAAFAVQRRFGTRTSTATDTITRP